MFEDLLFVASASGAAVAAAGAALWAVYTRCYRAVPPNRALVLFGRQSTGGTGSAPGPTDEVDVRRPKIVVGGGAFVAPWNKGFAHLSLDPVAVDVSVRSLNSLEGNRASGWEVALQVRVKIPAEPGSLARAADNLLGKTDEEVRALIRSSVEAAVPAVLSRLRHDAGEPDWDRLAAEVQAEVAPDLVGWGFLVRNVSVTELHRILPVEPPGFLPSRRPSPPTTPAGEAPRPDTTLAFLDARLARVERNLGVTSVALERLCRATALLGAPEAPSSILDLPLGSESPASDGWTEGAIASIHDSMEGSRSSLPSPRSSSEPRGRGGDGDRPLSE